MIVQNNIIDHLKEVFLDKESGLNGLAGSALHDFQKNSFETLSNTQFPDKHHEDWKYTSVQKLIAPKYRLSRHQPVVEVVSIPEMESYVISIINGKTDFSTIDPALENLGIKIISIQDAFESSSWRDAFSRWLTSTDLNANRAFDLLNFSFQSGGFFLDFPKNLILDKPIELRIVHDDAEISFSHPSYFIKCGSGSEVKIIERFEYNHSPNAFNAKAFINSLGYVHLERNSKLTYIKWQNLSTDQHLVYKLFVTQYRDSKFDMFAFDRGGNLVRNNIEVELEENNTYTSLQAGYLASGNQSMDHQTRINHKVAYCESHELYKGIIDDRASGAFNGKVFVHKDAQKTNAYQQNDTIVISPFALMNSKPQLEIYADDVKCSHGATIGQLDEKSIFYLRSRGLDEKTSKEILKKAFLAEVIEKITDIRIRDFVSTVMNIHS